MEPPDRPKANQNQLDLYATQGPQDLPLWDAPTMEPIQPVEVLRVRETWAYWRTKLVSVFQMCPVIIVGHSLSDPDIRQVLEAAKQGARH